MNELIEIKGQYPLDWKLCLVKDHYVYFSKDNPYEIYGYDWEDAPAYCNAGAPYCKFQSFRVTISGVLVPDYKSHYSAQDYNSPQCHHPWLSTDPCNRLSTRSQILIYSGITFRDFLRICAVLGEEVSLPVLLADEAVLNG